MTMLFSIVWCGRVGGVDRIGRGWPWWFSRRISHSYNGRIFSENEGSLMANSLMIMMMGELCVECEELRLLFSRDKANGEATGIGVGWWLVE